MEPCRRTPLGPSSAREHRQQPRRAHELGEHRMHQVRLLDAPHPRLRRAVRGLEVVDVVVRAHRASAFDQLGQHLLHALARHVVEQALDDDEAVAAVSRQAFGVDVGHADFPFRMRFRRSDGCANIYRGGDPDDCQARLNPQRPHPMPVPHRRASAGPRRTACAWKTWRVPPACRRSPCRARSTRRKSSSPTTLRAVRTAIERLRYVPNLTAGSLASNRSRTVAVIVPTVNNSIFSDTIDGLAQALASQRYQLLLGQIELPARGRGRARAGLPGAACRWPGADRRAPCARRAQQRPARRHPGGRNLGPERPPHSHAGGLLEPCRRLCRRALSAGQGPRAAGLHRRHRRAVGGAPAGLSRSGARGRRRSGRQRATRRAGLAGRGRASPGTTAVHGRAACHLLQQRHAGRGRDVRMRAPPHRACRRILRSWALPICRSRPASNRR